MSIIEFNHSFLTQQGQHFSSRTIKPNTAFPFKDHAQFPLLVDSLIRKNNPHLILIHDLPYQAYPYFLQAFVHHLAHDSVPHPLRECELTFLDLENTSINPNECTAIDNDFKEMLIALNTSDKIHVFALSADDLLLNNDLKTENAPLNNSLNLLLKHPNARLMLLTHEKKISLAKSLRHQFTIVKIRPLHEQDKLALLKQRCAELEAFHHVLISEEVQMLALSLTERYLCANDSTENTVLLLDSAAARISGLEPTLSATVLTNTLSGWTQIPATHLALNKIKHLEFIQGMQQRIFGQEAALTIISHELQQSQVNLQQSTGPFCSLLFCGIPHSGKRTVAIALADQLFKQANVLYCAEPTPCVPDSIFNITFQRLADKRYFSLQETLAECPYAIMLIENIDQLPAKVIDGLYEILSSGYLRDPEGNLLHFRQVILILSTTLGTDKLVTLAQSALTEEANNVNLMQLIMNGQNTTRHAPHDFSPQELAQAVATDLSHHLSSSLCQYLCIIPFLPLTPSAIENIIRLKLKLLIKLLDARHGIELGYANEVIRYLAHDSHTMGIDKTLKLLYFTIEQTVLNRTESLHRSNQLFLQLNESGQLLRCDWLMMTTSMQSS